VVSSTPRPYFTPGKDSVPIVQEAAETWTLQKIDQKCPGSFEMWCWRRMAKIIYTDRVKKVGVLRRVKEEWKILSTVTCRSVTCVGNMQRRDSVLQHVIEGKIGGTGRRGGRHKNYCMALRK
jgi:hypothetical protein